jgi:Ser/Thr protein kinase RdoA (MazF antagonist)
MDSKTAAALYAPAGREALRCFPIRARNLELIAVSENVTFRVVDETDDRPYVLRLHRPGYHSLEALNSERLWTDALNQAGVAVPRPGGANDGRYYIPVTVPASGEQRFAGVARWTDGEVLAEVMAREPDAERLPGWFEQLGAILAAMHSQAITWRPPAAFTRHHLDIEGLLGEAPFWGRFWEHPVLAESERRLLLKARDEIRAALARYGKGGDRYSVIHADLHPGNVLIDDGRLTVIDFDDTGFGWHMYDLAVALIHQQNRPYFPAVREALFRGYRSVRPLPMEQEAMLPMFLLIRGMAQIGWLYQRPEHSSAEHVDYLRRLRATVADQCRRFKPPH